ncbi:MAG: HAD-IIB family hydrolase, partial [Nitriliruptorales bacterium]
AGLALGFATGRMRAAVAPLWRQTRLGGPHIVHNGAEVRAEGRTIASWPLTPAQATTVQRLCAEHGWYAELYVGEGYFVTDARPEAAVHWGMLHRDPEGLVADLPGEAEVLKATVALFGDDPAPVVERLEREGLAAGTATSPMAPEVVFINVTDPRVDKGRALRRASEHLGVGLDEVVAIGDGLNDLSMLALAGTAIAMGQAPQAVREAAHLVVPEVADDGVAHALELVTSLRE